VDTTGLTASIACPLDLVLTDGARASSTATTQVTAYPAPALSGFAVKFVKYTIFASSNKKYRIDAVFSVTDLSTGNPVSGKAISMRSTWASSTGGFSTRTATYGYTTGPRTASNGQILSAGQILVQSPVSNVRSGQATHTINSVTMTGSTWNSAASTVTTSYSWSR